jgi:hypothetical protein
MKAMIDRVGDVRLATAATKGRAEEPPTADYDAGGRRITFYNSSTVHDVGLEMARPGDSATPRAHSATVSGGNMKAVYRHEFGHHVHDVLADDPRVAEFETKWRAAKDSYDRRFTTASTYEAREALSRGTVSYYSTTNVKEGFAEAFATVTHPKWDGSTLSDYDEDSQGLLRLMDSLVSG